MSIQVKFFASLRERTGKADMTLSPAGIATVADAWAASTDFEMPANTLVAINHEYVTREHAVVDGDEVAFFPPVTGG
ncbi:MAG: MoaD/ThiS family protein [Halothiobacillaceae bacterium]|nr:MAG: MoaD/ThiS family protein [Halothiobacillaceae bacterium]